MLTFDKKTYLSFLFMSVLSERLFYFCKIDKCSICSVLRAFFLCRIIFLGIKFYDLCGKRPCFVYSQRL